MLRPRTHDKGWCAHTYNLFDRRAERRCNVSHSVGSVMTRKFYSIFFKKSRGPVGSAPGRSIAMERNPLFPKISSARGSKMPAGILRRGRIARASPMDEVGSMPTSSIKIERAYHYRLRSHWNYVGRHGADKSLTCSPLQLSGGQLKTVTTKDSYTPEQSGGQSCDGTVPVLPVYRHLLSKIVLSS